MSPLVIVGGLHGVGKGVIWIPHYPAAAPTWVAACLVAPKKDSLLCTEHGSHCTFEGRGGGAATIPRYPEPPCCSTADMEPAQDEDDLYDLLHDEIAASRSRPRPGGAEDDEEQRQDTKVRPAPPPPHPLRASPRPQRAARWWRAAAEAGVGGEDGAVRRAAAAGRRSAVAGEPRRRPHCCCCAGEPGPPAPGQEADAHEGDARRQHLVALQDGGRRDRAEGRAEQGAERPVRPPGPLAPPERAQPRPRRFRAVTGSAQHAGRS